MSKVQELMIAAKMIRKSDDEINNLLYDLHTKYSISDTDWFTLMSASATITQRQIMEQLGKKNDAFLNKDGGGPDGTV